jgi:4-hydroxy-tetrahydrodipicolinate reductase
MKPIILCGSSGRMGQEVLKLIEKHPDFLLHASISRSGMAMEQVDFSGERPVIIDFSHHELLQQHLKVALKHNLGILVATTGHGQENYAAIDEASLKIPIVLAPNTSPMASLMLHMGQMAASVSSSIEIIDVHHQHKKDAPSGTAKALVKAFSNETLAPIHVHSIRAGEVIGDHSAYFFNDFERLELIHRVSDRRVFAQGALLAAQFLFGQKPGLYSMADVLKIK